MMQLLLGTGASRGIAAGPVAVLPTAVHVEERRLSEAGVAAEIVRFDAAVATTDAAMERIGLAPEVPHAGRDLVDTHRTILKSDEIVHETRILIRDRRLGAEWAVRLIVDGLRRVFSEMSDERFRERFDDVEAVTNRLLRTLLALPEANLGKVAGCVAVAVELSPLDALQLHRAGIIGLVTERGGPTSHAAILSRALGLPYVFGVGRLLESAQPAETICVDGSTGEVAIAPDAATLQHFAQRRADDLERVRALESGGASRR